MHLELVNNTIRTKLDEIKRMEVQRLQELARIKMRSMSGTEVLHFIAAHGGNCCFCLATCSPHLHLFCVRWLCAWFVLQFPCPIHRGSGLAVARTDQPFRILLLIFLLCKNLSSGY